MYAKVMFSSHFLLEDYQQLFVISLGSVQTVSDTSAKDELGELAIRSAHKNNFHAGADSNEAVAHHSNFSHFETSQNAQILLNNVDKSYSRVWQNNIKIFGSIRKSSPSCTCGSKRFRDQWFVEAVVASEAVT